MAELKAELIKNKEKLKDSVEERKRLKTEIDARDDSIAELQRRLTRAITVNNCKRLFYIQLNQFPKFVGTKWL